MDDTSGETTVVELPEITIRDCGPRISRETKNEKKIPWRVGKSRKKIYLCNVRKDKGSDRDSLNFLGKEIWNLVNILTQTL